MIGQLDMDQTVQNAVAAVDYLANHPASNGKVGAVGFCWGGAMANQVAVNAPAVAAPVAYSGRHPTPEQAAQIEPPVLLHHAARAPRLTAGTPAFSPARTGTEVAEPHLLSKHP